MPTALEDIIKAKNESIKEIEKKMGDAQTVLNACTNQTDAAKVSAKIEDLAQQRTDIADQAYEAAMNDPAMTAALNKIKGATKDMKDAASNLQSATAFITSLTAFFTAAGKVVPALKGLG